MESYSDWYRGSNMELNVYLEKTCHRVKNIPYKFRLPCKTYLNQTPVLRNYVSNGLLNL